MKQYNVTSKYKNPDLYVKRLKAEIDWKKQQIKYRDTKIEGLYEVNEKQQKQILEEKNLHNKALWFEYSEKSRPDVGVNIYNISLLPILQKIPIGEQVIFVGRITAKTLSLKENSAKFEIIKSFVSKNIESI